MALSQKQNTPNLQKTTIEKERIIKQTINLTSSTGSLQELVDRNGVDNYPLCNICG